MHSVLSIFLPSCLIFLLVGAGCATSQEPSATGNDAPARDSVILPEPPADEHVIALSNIALSERAELEQTTVGELALLRARTARELREAEELSNSGIYVGDEGSVLTLGLNAQAALGTDMDIGEPFEAELLVRMSHGGSFQIIASGEPAQPGRRMPSMIRTDAQLNDGTFHSQLLLGDEGQENPSQIAEMMVSPVSAQYAHLLKIEYEPGSYQLFIDGEDVFDEAVRIGGGAMHLKVINTSNVPLQILTWTFESD